MTNSRHPITPPPELVKQWATANGTVYKDLSVFCQNIANEAARWGADQELEACCEHLKRLWASSDTIDSLRAARRPKPSLKVGAIEVLDELDSLFELPAGHYNTILRALERLDD